jgi:hypothetical protein
MFAVEVRDHIMIAHSLPGAVFGPAQNNIVVDIGRALDALKQALAPLNYANLDEDPALAGQVTTTEFLAKTIFDRIAETRRAGGLGPHAEGITRMRVTLGESHVARGWYEADVG